MVAPDDCACYRCECYCTIIKLCYIKPPIFSYCQLPTVFIPNKVVTETVAVFFSFCCHSFSAYICMHVFGKRIEEWFTRQTNCLRDHYRYTLTTTRAHTEGVVVPGKPVNRCSWL